MRSKQSFQALNGNASRVFNSSVLNIKIGVALCASLLLLAAGPGGVAHGQTATSSVVKLLLGINKFAGTGVAGETGAGGQATAATLTVPSGLGFDGTGNVYISDYQTSIIHKVDNLGIITTVAGGGTAPTTCAGSTDAIGDGCLATQAQLNGPYVIAVDRAGNIFITDQQNNVIREVVAATGVIKTIVGGGAGAFYKGTTAVAGTSVAITAPDGIAIDAADNVFFSDSLHSVIYKATPAGGGAYNVAAYVGAVAIAGYSGDGGQSINAQVNQPIGLAVDANGNLFIADQTNNRIREVTAAGIISTVAGSGVAGYSGDGGTAINATFNNPRSVAIDYAGDLLVSDSQNLVVRIIYADPTARSVLTSSYVETLAGTGAACPAGTDPCGGGGLAINATFAQNPGGNGGSTQFGFDVPRGTFYIADLADNRVRALAPSTTFPATAAGSTSTELVGLQLVGGVPATISSISIAPNPTGAQEFTVTGIAGQPANTAEGTPALTCSTNGTTANVPGTICNVTVTFTPQYPGNQTAKLTVVTSQGTFVYGLNGVGTSPLAALSPAQISTFVGTGTGGYSAGPQATAAQINGPTGSFFDGAGNYYFADQGNHVIRKVTPAGVISVVAGVVGVACAPPAPCGDNGLATAANLYAPHGAVLDAAGNMYIADTSNDRIRRVDGQTGIITTIAGTGVPGFNGDGGPATAALLFQPQAVALDPAGNLYIADSGNNEIRIISAGSLYIFPYAGNNVMCATTTAACGDGGPATAANLNLPVGMAFDPAGNLVFADTDDNRFRLVAASTGFISTVVGTGQSGNLDNVPATMGQMNLPGGIAIDPGGNYYLSDFVNSAVRRVDATTKILSTIVGNFKPCAAYPCGDGGPSSAAQLVYPNSIALDQTGNVVISDYGANVVRKISVGGANLNFATTQVNLTSTDSPKTEFLQNIGNAPLTLSQPTTGTNASISTGFTQGNTETCPQLTNATATLASGAECSYSVSFTPLAVKTYAGTLVETDNSLNVPGSTQTVTLNGIGVADTTTDTLTSSPNPSTYGQTVAFTYTVPTVGGVPATGTVTCTYGSLTFAGPLNANGVAIINEANLPVGSDAVTCTYGGNATYAPSTAGVTQVVNKAPVTNPTMPALSDTISAAPSPTTPGTLVTVTFSVPVITGDMPPAGPVTFTSNGATFTTATMFAAAGPAVNGITIYTTTATTTTLPVGTDTITGTYPNTDPNYAPGSLQTTVVVSSATLTAATPGVPNATASTYGTPVTLTDTVAPVNGICPATATFKNGAATLGTGNFMLTNGNCIATYGPTTALPVGVLNLTATTPASGTGANALPATSAPLTFTVSKSPVTNPNPTPGTPNLSDTISAAPTPTTFGTLVTVTFSVPVPTGNTPPTGPVTFTSNGATFTTSTPFALVSTANGISIYSTTATTTTLPVGTDTITGTYPNTDPNYAPGSLQTTVVVTTATPTSVVTSGPANPGCGTPVTLTDTLTQINNTPFSGTVQFFDTVNGVTTSLGSVPVSAGGVATLTNVTTLTCGATNSITAVFTPSAGSPYGPVTGGPILIPVGAGNGLNTVTANPNPSVYGTLVNLIYTVPTQGATAATGTVTCTVPGQTVTGTLNASGVATIPVNGLPVGANQPVSCSYGGNGTYAAGTANTTVTVTTATPVSVVTSGPANPGCGAPVTLTDTLTQVNNTAFSGTVQFFDTVNGMTNPIGNPVPVSAGGVATLTNVTTLPCGVTNSITAVFTPSAGSPYGPVTGGPILIPVGAGNLANAVVANPNPSVYGTLVNLIYTVPTQGTTAATGTVTCTIAGTKVTGTLNGNGVATLPVNGLPVGANPASCTYTGNGTYAAGSATTTATVTPVTPISIITGPPGVPPCGTAVTLTDTFTLVNGTPLGGTVQFFANGSPASAQIPVPASGIVTFTTTSLPCQVDIITSIYTPPAGSPYGPVMGGPITVNVGTPDFSITATPPNQIVNPGDTTTYTVSLSGINGAAFTSPVTLTATGLPPGAKVTFAMPTYVPGVGPTSTTMTIVTAPNQAMLRQTNGMSGIAYGLLLLPLLGVRRIRRKLRALPKSLSYGLAALLLLGGLGAVTGCGGGYFGPAAQTFTVVVTGTSGALVHSTGMAGEGASVTLTVR